MVIEIQKNKEAAIHTENSNIRENIHIYELIDQVGGKVEGDQKFKTELLS